jgi:hypothetical protein
MLTTHITLEKHILDAKRDQRITQERDLLKARKCLPKRVRDYKKIKLHACCANVVVPKTINVQAHRITTVCENANECLR